VENVAIQFSDSQKNKSENTSDTIKPVIPSGGEFFEMLEQQLRDIACMTIINTIQDEFKKFTGAVPYQRDDRTDSRSRVRYRDFDTRFGVIRDIAIPGARNGQFIPQLVSRWKRRKIKITRAIAELLINGISTRKVKKITKVI
jgi:putative transposase